MLKWFSGDEGEPGSAGPGSPHAAAQGGEVAVEEMAERLAQTEQLVSQLKEMIREKEAALRCKDEQLKVEKEAGEARLSKLRLQNKAKVTSLTSQLEELRKQQGGPGTPTHTKKAPSEGGEPATRGKVVLLKKKVEELEQQLAKKDEELENQRKQQEARRQRGEEMDAMLTERDRKLAEKEAYIVHLQGALAGDQPGVQSVPPGAQPVPPGVQSVPPGVQPVPPGDQPVPPGVQSVPPGVQPVPPGVQPVPPGVQSVPPGDQPVPPPPQPTAEQEAQEAQLLVQSLTKKVGEAEERYSLLQEQTQRLQELLSSEEEQFSQKEDMYKQNIQTFKEILIQKEEQLNQMNQNHEQQLFKLAAKSDASADLEQLLKVLKQKLHEKEEVLGGKAQVIDVLQGELDGRDQQIQELAERLRRLQVERESLESKMEAEKHVMRAQLRDLMEKQQAEVERLGEQHRALMEQSRLDLRDQLEALRSSAAEPDPGSRNPPDGPAAALKVAQLQAQVKMKGEEAGRSEAKFLKMKAWSKTRIRQLEEELKKSQAGGAPPDLTALRSRVTALEEEREENLWKVERYEELQAKNGMLEAKLVVYEEQQRALQADLEQFTKRAASQASESGSTDDTQSQVLEWQEMVAEARDRDRDPDRDREEKAGMALRIGHMEEEREALATRQQELEEEQEEEEEELAGARGSGRHRTKKLGSPARRSLQEDFALDGQTSFQDPRSASESTTPMEGENMGGWWPEHSAPDTDGLRSLVEELELERNQLQEQILSLEERCQDLEDRVQLQTRIEALQSETDRLQVQLASARTQQARDAEKQQLLVSSLTQQLRGLTEAQEGLQSSLVEKENTLAQTCEKLELLDSLRDSLDHKERQHRELGDQLVQAEQALEDASRKFSGSEKQGAELKAEVTRLTQKLSSLKEKTLKQESTMETLQAELDQTNEELDKINSAHLEERAQLIHDLQSREREIDSLKDVLLEKDKEIKALAGNMAEYAEQAAALKQEVKLKEESLGLVEAALNKAEREAALIRDSQGSDQQELNGRISELAGKARAAEEEAVTAREEREAKAAEVELLVKEVEEDRRTIRALRGDVQQHRHHLSECQAHMAALKEQLEDGSRSSQELRQQLGAKEQTHETELKSFKDEQNRLLSQVEKYGAEVETLSKRLEEQVQSEQLVKTTIQQKLEAIASLEDKLQANEELLKEERHKFQHQLQLRDTENQKLSRELQSESESVLKLKNLLKDTRREKQQLQEKLKGLKEELHLQKHNVEEVGEKAASAAEVGVKLENQVLHLTEEKQRLEAELTERQTHASRLTAELEALQETTSTLESRLSQHVDVVDRLQEEKEALAARTSELQQNTNCSSEALLVKTAECVELSRRLREEEQQVAQLHQQALSSQQELEGKEQIAADLRAQLETQQNLRARLQDTAALLREAQSVLEAGLAEKEAVVKQQQRELSAQTEAASRLRAEAEALAAERSQLKRQLVQREEGLRDAGETLEALTEQLGVLEAGRKQQKCEAEQRQTETDTLKSHIQLLGEENLRLQAACQSGEQEASELDQRLKTSLEHNSALGVTASSLAADQQRLQEQVAQANKSLSELTSVRNSLQETNAGLERQVSDEQQTTRGLLQEKEELQSTCEELEKVLKERGQSDSAALQEKSHQCARLAEALQLKDQQLLQLQDQADHFNTQVEQLNTWLAGKEQVVSERAAQLEAQHNQLLQLQDTTSMLREQGAVLKAALAEKDAALRHSAEDFSVCQQEARRQLDLLSSMQQEVEEKDAALRKAAEQVLGQREELSRRSEAVASLGGQLGLVEETAAETEAELKFSIQKLATENQRLVQEEERRKAEGVDLRDEVEALTEQNARLKAELQDAVQETSTARGQVTGLEAAAADRDHVLQATRSALRQNEDLIEQLSRKVAEQEEQLRQTGSHNISLQARVSELEASSSHLGGQVQALTSEAVELKRALEEKEESSVESRSLSTSAVENLQSQLQTKSAECESLKEHVCHLEESVSKLSDALQVQESEVRTLKEALEGKGAELRDQCRSLQDVQRRADEASLFKTQFMENSETVLRLQSRTERLSAEAATLRASAEETRGAFNQLQDKHAASLEELRDVRRRLSESAEDASGLRTSLDASRQELRTAQAALEALSREASRVRRGLEESRVLNRSLSRDKEDALASHRAAVSQLTVETDRLKSQHLQVAAQMDALAENLEQREMALHAINGQYAAQAKHAAQLASQLQRLEEQNRELHAASGSENAHLQQEVRRLVGEKEELERRCLQIRASQEELQQKSNGWSQTAERLAAEKQNLQAKVSAKDRDMCQLEEDVRKVGQVLQDSEREWLSVLDREKRDKTLLAEQLRTVEDEMKSKDVKVHALQQDLDGLQSKLAAAAAAIRLGSDQLSAKESEAAASRVQLENVLASIREKDRENIKLRRSLKAVGDELRDVLVLKPERSSSDAPAAPEEDEGSLQEMMKALKERHRSDVGALRRELTETAAQLQNTQKRLEERDVSGEETGRQAAALHTSVQRLQTRLQAEADKHSAVLREVAAKDERVNGLNVQISQQKELLAGLSQQLKDRDASIVQVMEAASNERVKLGEENSCLLVRLAKLEQALQTSTQTLEELEEQLTSSQREVETLNVEKQELVKGRAELQADAAKASKERDVVKKKLQAALLLRKDLLKRVEEYEKQKEESVDRNTEVSQLQEKLQEISRQAEAADESFKEKLSLLDKKLLDKESEMLEYKTQSQRLVEELQWEKEELGSALRETEARPSGVGEKESLVKQLQTSAAQKDADCGRLALKVDELQEELKTCRQELQDKPSSGRGAEELAQLRAEKATLQKKAQAALLARKDALKKAQEGERKFTQELAELKDDYKALLEQHCQQTNELNAVQLDAGQKSRELEALRRTALADLDQLQTLRQLVDERDKDLHFLKASLADKERQCHSLAGLQTELGTLKSRLEDVGFEMLSKDEALAVATQTAQALECKVTALEEDLQEAHAEVRMKSEELRRHQGVVTDVKAKAQQEHQALQPAEDHTQTAATPGREAIVQVQSQGSPEDSAAPSARRALVVDKDGSVAALELQRQVQTQEVAVAAMRLDSEEVRRSQDGRVSLLTRKLQAALVSRKELMKEIAALKEEVAELSSGNQAKEAEVRALGESVSRLKQEAVDLRSRLASAAGEKQGLGDEVARVRSDNGSLELTVHNISQQNWDLSGQLEALRHAHTQEGSRWRAEHAQLRQEHQALLRAHENVSGETDGMRRLVDGARRERQEALRETQQREAERQVLEEENQEVKKELAELQVTHRKSMSEMQKSKRRPEAELRQLEAELRQLEEASHALKAEKQQLAEKLEEARVSLDKRDFESSSDTNNMQLKLDEALDLNNSLTAQIKAQKTELAAQMEVNDFLQKEKQNLSERTEKLLNEQELQLGQKDESIRALEEVLRTRDQEAINLKEGVRILEDDKSLLQDELDNAQEASDKVKSENEGLEGVILKNCERVEELTESLRLLQTHKAQLAAQLAASQETGRRVRQEKEQEQLKLVRELEDRLKTVQRGSEGTKNVKKELQELLREKHREVNQLQQSCIKYQELVLDLESSLKSSQSTCQLLEEDLKKSSEKVSALEEKRRLAEDQLAASAGLRREAEDEVEKVQAERDRLALQVSQNQRTPPPQSVEESPTESCVEKQSVLQQQLEELRNLKDGESQKVEELRRQLDSQHLQLQTLRRAAESGAAALSALSSSPQGADASRRWDRLYHKTLQEKDNQLLEQGFMIKRFLEDARLKDKEVNELRVTRSRLERTLSEYSVAAAAQQRQLFVMSAGNAELSEAAELTAAQLKELGAELERLGRDKNALIRRLADRDDAVSQAQLRLRQLERAGADTDSQLRVTRADRDKVRADLEKQAGMSLQLKTLVRGKDAEIASLLSCRDGQMSGYLEQLQANHRAQASVYEDRLTALRYQRDEAEKGSRGLEAQVKSLQARVNGSEQAKEQMAAKMESFKNSLVSLQSDRERLLSQHRILEAKAQLGPRGREGVADGEGGAAKGLKHEIRKLLHQMDDLNSENAMLRAQLLRYREDLNQVLSLKDHQAKALLKKQQEAIRTLEVQKAESLLERRREEEAGGELRADNAALKSRLSELEAEVSDHRRRRGATEEGRVILDLQGAVAAKAAECGALRQELLSVAASLDELRGDARRLEKDAAQKLSEAEDRYGGELDALQRDVGVMRGERETADRRLAELAADLLEAERRRAAAESLGQERGTQNQSLCKAMAALQDDRDQLIRDFKVLRDRYDRELRDTRATLSKAERRLRDATADLAAAAKERDVLAHRLRALGGRDPAGEQGRLLDQVSRVLGDTERDLKKSQLDQEGCRRQLDAFSSAMASLQDDRDRLLDRLLEAKGAAGPGGGPPEGEAGGARTGRAGRTAGGLQQEDVREETLNVTCAAGSKASPPVQEAESLWTRVQLEETVQRLEAERKQLQVELQRASEDQAALGAELRTVSQTLRDSESRCLWLEAQGAVLSQGAPGAPQERSSSDAPLRERLAEAELALAEAELTLAEERARREAAEEALRTARQPREEEERDTQRDTHRDTQRDTQGDFCIAVDPEDQWDAVSLDPAQPLITRQVRGGAATCRRWLRGRSLYLSRLLSRSRSRCCVLLYLLGLHVLVLWGLAGAL